MDVFDAAERYRQEGRQLIILAGKDYGSGSSRDWAAKGPWMQVREKRLDDVYASCFNPFIPLEIKFTLILVCPFFLRQKGEKKEEETGGIAETSFFFPRFSYTQVRAVMDTGVLKRYTG